MKTLTLDNTTYTVIGYWVDARSGDENMQLVSAVGSVRQHRIKKETSDNDTFER